ncbi:hypothetical protein PCANC_01239 [Puccinia coronata f. sp. avenae]|uniref:Uncharacterized protein n=1 Tax=Puccinia coronata f. sp. avenae TaxID=200324 RepID=A0A2N5W3Q8_9BASI|nr:hypothetical protein PCANC_01239 [Puccinia coronata f. sp. avenae]
MNSVQTTPSYRWQYIATAEQIKIPARELVISKISNLPKKEAISLQEYLCVVLETRRHCLDSYCFAKSPGVATSVGLRGRAAAGHDFIAPRGCTGHGSKSPAPVSGVHEAG